MPEHLPIEKHIKEVKKEIKTFKKVGKNKFAVN